MECDPSQRKRRGRPSALPGARSPCARCRGRAVPAARGGFRRRPCSGRGDVPRGLSMLEDWKNEGVLVLSDSMNARPLGKKDMRLRVLALIAMAFCVPRLWAQTPAASIQFDPATRVFRLDAADVTYVLGVNEAGEVQTLYWGGRLPASDHFAAAKQMPAAAAFDLPVTTTPQEFVGWGGGSFVEPDLKITFPNGNRDLVLKYVSHSIEGNQLAITMKDIKLDVYVT